MPAHEIAVAEALRNEPRLNPGIMRAIEVQDGSVDGWQLVWGAANSAKAYGAQVLTYHPVTRIDRDGQPGHRRALHRPEVRRRGASSTATSC